MPGHRNTLLIEKTDQTQSETFYQTLINLGYKPKSCRTAQLNLEDFFHFIHLQGITDLKHIKTSHLVNYHKHLQTKPNQTKGGTLHPKTIHQRLQNLNHFFTQQTEQGKIRHNPFDRFIYPYPKTPSKERTLLTQVEIQLLYKQAETPLEKALLSLAYGCGLRADELEQLNIADIDFSRQHLIVKQGKGNKRRVVPLAKKVQQDLENYLQIRLQQHVTTPSFLLNRHNKRYREYSGNYLLKKLVKRSNNKVIKAKEISLHILRHSIATHLLEEGLSLEKVRDFLGHSQLETTQIYVHISQTQLKQIQYEPDKLYKNPL